MGKIKVVSFDLEGTLVTPDFSQAVWHEVIPSLYARKMGISHQDATAAVIKQYNDVGDRRIEWYDIRYWFNRFGLDNYQKVLSSCSQRVCYYPEVAGVLSSLYGTFRLVVATGSTREFLQYLLRDIEHYFERAFSSISDSKQLKTPSFYLGICEAMSIAPEEMAHIGDSWQFDFLAPREAGVMAFHLARNNMEVRVGSLKSLLEFQAKLLEIV